MKFVFRINGDLNFEILVEDFDTGRPSSIMATIENFYLLVNSDIVKNR